MYYKIFNVLMCFFVFYMHIHTGGPQFTVSSKGFWGGIECAQSFDSGTKWPQSAHKAKHKNNHPSVRCPGCIMLNRCFWEWVLSPCTTNCPVSFCLLLSLSPSFLKKMKILCLSLPVCLCLSPSLPSETEYAIYIFIFQQNLYTDFVRDHLSGKTPSFILPAAPLLAGFDVRVFFFSMHVESVSEKTLCNWIFLASYSLWGPLWGAGNTVGQDVRQLCEWWGWRRRGRLPPQQLQLQRSGHQQHRHWLPRLQRQRQWWHPHTRSRWERLCCQTEVCKRPVSLLRERTGVCKCNCFFVCFFNSMPQCRGKLVAPS